MHITATKIEACEMDELGTIVTHFDSGKDSYLQIQGAMPGFEEDYYDGGYVYIEIDDQLYGGFDCFNQIILSESKIEILGITNERIKTKGEHIVVEFEIDKQCRASIISSLKKTFRDCPYKLTIQIEPCVS